MIQHPTFTLPIVEHKGHTPYWRIRGMEWPDRHPAMKWVNYVEVSQSRDCEWWFRFATTRQYGPQRYITCGPWQPVPGFGFELPKTARLSKKTAMLPKLSVLEWVEEQRRQAEWDEIVSDQKRHGSPTSLKHLGDE